MGATKASEFESEYEYGCGQVVGFGGDAAAFLIKARGFR
jgi:hypothetical protein